MQCDDWKAAANNKQLWDVNEDIYVQDEAARNMRTDADDDGASRRPLLSGTLKNTRTGSRRGARAPSAHLARLDRETP